MPSRGECDVDVQDVMYFKEQQISETAVTETKPPGSHSLQLLVRSKNPSNLGTIAAFATSAARQDQYVATTRYLNETLGIPCNVSIEMTLHGKRGHP